MSVFAKPEIRPDSFFMRTRTFDPAWRTLSAATTERFCLLHKLTSFKNREDRGGRVLKKAVSTPQRRKKETRQTDCSLGGINLSAGFLTVQAESNSWVRSLPRQRTSSRYSAEFRFYAAMQWCSLFKMSLRDRFANRSWQSVPPTRECRGSASRNGR